MPLQENAQLGPYRIMNKLGEGGMGAVYRARDTRLGRDVAIKILTAVTLSDREKLQRFEQEARATGMLNHPNLLTIYDVGNSEGTPFLVSELLEGETLRTRIDRGPIPPRKAVDIALQLAHGLAAAHEKGIVHRDLKPENVFITKEGRVKILDFGIAKLSATGSEGPSFQMAATEPGMVLGTVGYMSPEQIRGELVDRRSDIFAFGAIVYEMLTGKRAFKRSSSIETLSAILKEDPPDLSEALPNIPPQLEKLVRRCLEKDRDQRFQSARDLAFNLETLSTFSTVGTLSSVPRPQEPGDSTLRAATVRTASPPLAHPATTPLAPAVTRAPTLTRARTVAVPPPKARVSSRLLSLLYIVSIAGAAFGGWYLATRIRGASSEVAFRRMTFRRGEIRGARFGPDGDTIIYGATWDGQPTEIYVANRQSTDARPLGIRDAEVLAVSKSTELAVLLRRDRSSGIGTLARVPLSGGIPREIADDVVEADFSPDGGALAIIRVTGGKYRIEYPLGTVRYDAPHELRNVRVSPDGNRLAFIEPHGEKYDVAILEKGASKPVTIARGWDHGATGMAWRSDQKEIWITGTDSGAPPALFAVDASSGDTRLVNRLTGSMKLYDLSSAGRLLLSNGTWRAALEYQPPAEPGERDISWLDWSMLADLSPDGRTVLFNETREGGGAGSAVYLRRADTASPVRIGDGFGDALSPDGKLVFCHAGPKLVVLPTGSGEARELKIVGAFDRGAAWLPDSRHVVVAGATPEHGYQLLILDTLDEAVRPISPENIVGETTRAFAVSPDGRNVAGMTKDETIALYPIDGGKESPVAGSQKGEIPIQWSSDGGALYVYRPTALPSQVFRITLSTGARELWKQFTPTDPAGVYKIAPICMSRDAGAYAYDALRTMSDLYVVEGLR
jgi:serine/threonine protein kinase/Tol biopolymer transport system component